MPTLDFALTYDNFFQQRERVSLRASLTGKAPELPGGLAYLFPVVLGPLASEPQFCFFLPLAVLPLALVVFFFSWAGFDSSPVAGVVADPAQTPST